MYREFATHDVLTPGICRYRSGVHSATDGAQAAGLDIGWGQRVQLEWNPHRRRHSLDLDLLPGAPLAIHVSAKRVCRDVGYVRQQGGGTSVLQRHVHSAQWTVRS